MIATCGQAVEDRHTYLRRFKCKTAHTGEKRVAERLVYTCLFDTTATERSSNGVDGLLDAMDGKRLEKLQHTGTAATVVAPRWEGKAWHLELTEMVAEELAVEPRASLFRPWRREGRGMIGMPHWPVTIFRVPFRHSLNLSATNNFCKDHGRKPMALGDLAGKLRKPGLAASHVTLYPELMRASLPVRVVLKAMTLAKALRLELGLTRGMDLCTVLTLVSLSFGLDPSTTLLPRMPITRRAAAAATMADYAATAAAAAAGRDTIEIDTHVSRVIQVEPANTKARVPPTDIINSSDLLGDRRDVRQLIAFFTDLKELITGI
eukprot:jgi/Tetstr1/433375/TSEL_022660.t1